MYTIMAPSSRPSPDANNIVDDRDDDEEKEDLDVDNSVFRCAP